MALAQLAVPGSSSSPDLISEIESALGDTLNAALLPVTLTIALGGLTWELTNPPAEVAGAVNKLRSDVVGGLADAATAFGKATRLLQPRFLRL